MIGVQGDKRDPETEGRVCSTCRAFPCFCPPPDRAERCACGGLIVARPDRPSEIQAAVLIHNRSTRHQQWWESVDG